MSGSFSSPTKKGGIPDLQVAAEIVTGIAMTHHCSNRVSNLILLPIFPDRLFLIDSLDIRLLHAAKHSDGEAREGADVRREIAELERPGEGGMPGTDDGSVARLRVSY